MPVTLLLLPTGTKALIPASGAAQLTLADLAREEWMFEQLRDFVTLTHGVRLVPKVFHQHDDLASIPGIDHAGIAHQPLLRQPRAALHNSARGRYKLDRDSGVDAGRSACWNREIFGRVQIVAYVLSGMSDGRQQGMGGQPLCFQHEVLLCQNLALAFFAGVMSDSEVSLRRIMNDRTTRPPVPFLDEDAIRPLLPLEDLIPAMEQALIDFSSGRVLQPVRTIVPIPHHNGLMGLMPAMYGELMGTKLVNVYPDNVKRGLTSHQAMIVLFDATSGVPLAVMDGRLITELRTAAVSAVATKLLSPANVCSLAILGSGVQARAHFHALSLVRKFDDVRIWSRNAENAKALANEIGARTCSPEDAVRGADVIVTVTNSPEPILHGKWLKSSALVNAVGAVGPSRRELDNEAMRGAVIVDSREAALKESGDLLLAQARIYAELGEILSGAKAVPNAELTVFKSLGIAVEDLAAAKLVLRALGILPNHAQP
jgi:ornithine cyclodeaminase/alanine dehydrogenase-like protein (mu-crystallin family)